MIIRTEKQKRFTTVDNAPFQDKRLPWDTRGLMAYLLTKPDGWEIRVEDLLKQEEPEDKPEGKKKRATGREKIFRMLRDLKAYGYLYRDQVNGVDGRFETICYIYENPADNPYWVETQETEEEDENEPAEQPELTEQELAQFEFDLAAQEAVVGKDDHGQTAVGKAVHGAAVHGKAANGVAVNGKTANGKADRLLNTDRSNTDRSIQRGRNQRLNDDPPHIRQMAALNGVGLTAAQKELMNNLRIAFGFYDAEAAADATRLLSNAGAEVWDEEMKDLLAALKEVTKGVSPNTLFRDFFALLMNRASAEEIRDLFGSDRNVSWWAAASGMRGQPWPSQVANNLNTAREWEIARLSGQVTTPAATPATKAASSLAEFAARMAGQGGQ